MTLLDELASIIAQRRFELSGQHNVSGTMPPGSYDRELARAVLRVILPRFLEVSMPSPQTFEFVRQVNEALS